jgi:hypothetical protein
MVTQQMYQEIQKLKRKGIGISAASEELELDRKTVSKTCDVSTTRQPRKKDLLSPVSSGFIIPNFITTWVRMLFKALFFIELLFGF